MLFLSGPILGIGKFEDCLIYKSDTISLIDLRPNQYLDTSQLIRSKMFHKLGYLNMNNIVGNASSWMIENDSLYLLSIKIKHIDYIKDTLYVDNVDLNEIFIGRYLNGKILADWFSGSLYSPLGKCVFSADEGLVTSYEKELELNIQNGMLLEKNILDNSKSKQVIFEFLYQSSDPNKFGLREHLDSLINWELLPVIPDKDIRVWVNFSSNEDGVIDSAKVSRPRGDIFDTEAVRVIKTLPGEVRFYHGKLHRVRWSMPVIFKESNRKKFRKKGCL